VIPPSTLKVLGNVLVGLSGGIIRSHRLQRTHVIEYNIVGSLNLSMSFRPFWVLRHGRHSPDEE
jgi:hypothetical protein